MNPRHYQFCLSYLQTHDPGVAYKMAYPKANNHSVYASASRLMARPDVSSWIRETERRVHERVLNEMEEEMGGVLKNQLLTINQKRAVLTRIITGETKRVRHIKTKYSYEKVEDDLPIYAVLRAIDMDTRLENFYNLLSNPDTWRRTQTVYVNTPTLQQQVNVLINQTTNKAEETVQHELSTAPENSPLERVVGVCPHAQESTQHSLFPAGGGVGQASDGGGPLAQENTQHSLSTAQPNNTRSVSPKCNPATAGGGKGENTKHNLSPAQENSPFEGGGDAGAGGCPLPQENITTQKKTPHYLTLLNNSNDNHLQYAKQRKHPDGS